MATDTTPCPPPASSHTPVLLHEAVVALLHHPEASYVDGTFGRGGHTREILRRLGPRGRLLAFDRDPQAVAEAAQIQDPRFCIQHQNFSALGLLEPTSVDGGVLLDLGLSSPQLDQAARGFSFRLDGPLDMRMDTSRGLSAALWLAQAPVDQITQVVRDYGEERFAAAVAKAIVAARQQHGPIESTGQLAHIVAGAVKSREAGQHPATRTFQAIRIFVNAELEELEQALMACLNVLAPGARLAVISFHSLEDRIVKQFIARHSHTVYDRRAPFASAPEPKLKALARIKPSAAEVAANPRARSAILRVAERTRA